MRRVWLFLLVPVLALVPALAFIRYFWAILFAPERALSIAIGFDQLANVVSNGSEDETISSRANRARQEGRRWGCFLCWVLDRLDKNHCRDASGT